MEGWGIWPGPDALKLLPSWVDCEHTAVFHYERAPHWGAGMVSILILVLPVPWDRSIVNL